MKEERSVQLDKGGSTKLLSVATTVDRDVSIIVVLQGSGRFNG